MKKLRFYFPLILLLLCSSVAFSQMPTCAKPVTMCDNHACFGNFQGLTNKNIDDMSKNLFSVNQQNALNANTPDLCFGSNTSAYPSNIKTLSFCNNPPQSVKVTNSSNFLHLFNINLKDNGNGNPQKGEEAFCLPLSMPLCKGVEYEISFRKFSGCSNTISFDFSEVLPCLDVWQLYQGLTGNIKCNTGNFIQPQSVNVNYTGNLKDWEKVTTTFVADRSSQFVIFRQLPISQQQGMSSLYIDDIVIKPKPKGVKVTQKTLKQCIGGTIEIEYEVCALDNLPYQIEMTPDTKPYQSFGATIANSGDFPNGAIQKFTLDGKKGQQCKTLKLVLNAPNAMPINYLFTFVTSVVSTDICSVKTSQKVGSPIKMYGESSDFTAATGTCNLLTAYQPGPPIPGHTHLWEVTSLTTGLVFFTSKANTFTLDPIASGDYRIKHTLYFPCGSTVTSRLVTVTCDEKCDCDPNSGGFNLNTSMISGGQLLSTTSLFKANSSIAKNTCIYLKGHLIIDKDYILDGVNLKAFGLLNPSSRIIVNPNVKLTIRNSSKLYGCPTMWMGIKVEPGGILDITNSTVKDAWTGIDLSDNASIKIQNNQFLQNLTNIKLSAADNVSPAAVNFLGGAPITGNTFKGGINATLKDPSFSIKSTVGIYLGNAILDIGKDGYAKNDFIEIQNGINANNSTVTVKNCDFTGLFGSGIDARNNSKILDLNKANFNNMGYGIFANTSSSIKITGGVTMDNLNIGIQANQISKIQIENATIKFKEHGIRQSINPLVEESFIKKTILENRNPAIFSEYQRYGIHNSYTNFTNIPKPLLIEDVTVYQISDAPYSNNTLDFLSGVAIFNSSNVKLLNNSNYATTNPLVGLEGIYLQTNDNIKIKNCNLNTNDNFSKPLAMAAISLNNTVNSRICCSILNGFRWNGLIAYGAISNSFIRNNDFKNGAELFCYNQTELSVQKNAKNKWESGIDHDILAVHWAGWNLAQNPSDQKYIDGSRIQVSEDFSTTSGYWAKNGIIPKLLNPGAANPNPKDWFHKKYDPNSFVCSTDPECNAPSFKSSTGVNEDENFVETVTVNDTMAARGVYKNASYGTMMAWKTARFLYKKLSENPYLLEVNNLMDSFYNSTNETTIAKLYAIEKGINDLNIIDKDTKWQLDAGNSQIELSTKNIENYNESLVSAENKEDSEIFENLRREDQVLLVNAVERLNYTEGEIRKKRLELVENLILENKNIPTKALWEENEKVVNDITLKTVLSYNLNLSEDQVNQLANIAFQCDLEGGRAVIVARGLYEYLWKPIGLMANEFCEETLLVNPSAIAAAERANNESIEKSIETEIKNNTFALSPNPTQGDLTISIANFDKDANYGIIISTFTGEQLLKTSIQNEKEQISTKQLSAGVYFCTLQKNDRVQGIQRLIIIK